MRDTIERRRPATGPTLAAIIAMGSSSLFGCLPLAHPENNASCTYTEKSEEIIVRSEEVLRCLGSIAIKGRSPKIGCERSKFGDGWGSIEGCDTRNFILKRDLEGEVIKNTCTVTSGTLYDQYSGKTIDFKRGQDTSPMVQIDHIVALSDAWQKGADAQHMDETTREALANDPKNLLAVYGPENEEKSDHDAASWLPENKAYRCEMVASQTIVKLAYGLWMTSAEKTAITGVLATPKGEVLHLPN